MKRYGHSVTVNQDLEDWLTTTNRDMNYRAYSNSKLIKQILLILKEAYPEGLSETEQIPYIIEQAKRAEGKQEKLREAGKKIIQFPSGYSCGQG